MIIMKSMGILAHAAFMYLALGLAAPCMSFAQTLQYMDSSGNIIFANSIDEVPLQYREQVGYRDEQKELKKLLTSPPPAQADRHYQEQFRRWQQKELEKREQLRHQRQLELQQKKREQERLAQEKKAAQEKQQQQDPRFRPLPPERGTPTPTPSPRGPATF